MTRTRLQAIVLVGLIAVSLGLYWVAQADQTVLEVAGLLGVVALSLAAILRR
jgi:ABC-type Fe3+-siderophore transport system permease subunit